MANLTLAIGDDVLKRARIRALQQNTSVNALVREYLVSYSGSSESQAAMDRVLELAASSTAGSGGRSWTRDDAHER
jgi:plasmid stability protein